MATLVFPANASQTAMPIEPWMPGQVSLQSPFTGTVQVLDRGYASWRGTIEIAIVDVEGEAVGKGVEAFLSSLEGQGNIALIPLNRPTIAVGASTTIAAIVDGADGTLSLQLSSTITTEVGEWLASGNRRYIVRAVNAAGDEVTLDPQMPIGVGSALTRATDIRIRAQPGSRTMRRSANYWGPWRLDWQEAV